MDCIDAGWSVPKHNGSRMKASATSGLRLNQSNGVRAGMNEAFRKFSPGCADLASRASPSRVPDPESTSPSIKSLCLRTYCCAAKDPMLCPSNINGWLGVSSLALRLSRIMSFTSKSNPPGPKSPSSFGDRERRGCHLQLSPLKQSRVACLPKIARVIRA
ncbi:MAG: hypothetical protein JWM99_2855 [Verrucomicrobiales bacterium]|nr:hypothetical protein [Verrucomicrobiales bacterium]